MNSLSYFDEIALSDFDEVGDELIRNCFERFRDDEGNALKIENFGTLARQLFTDAEGKSYDVTDSELNSMFNAFDLNHDGKIDEKEFKIMWTNFIICILRPKSALIVIDVQNDFIDGSLAIRNCPAAQEGCEVVEVINDLVEHFKNVIYTFDWHPENHISFVDNVSEHEFHEDSSVKVEDAKVFDIVLFQGSPEFEQKLWPRHCVQNSWGSELHPQLKVADGAIFIYKGTSSNIDSYSAFWDNQKKSQTNLDNELRQRDITDVFVCGLAYDYCVGSTALHSLEFGYRTILIEDACRGVSHEDMQNMKEQLISRRGVIINSEDVRAMVEGQDRRPQLGVTMALSFLQKEVDNFNKDVPNC